MKNPQYESMRAFSSGEHRIRVWITETAIGGQDAANDIASSLSEQMSELVGWSLLAKLGFISTYDDRIAAVEVLDSLGNGALVYPDWK